MCARTWHCVATGEQLARVRLGEAGGVRDPCARHAIVLAHARVLGPALRQANAQVPVLATIPLLQRVVSQQPLLRLAARLRGGWRRVLTPGWAVVWVWDR